MKLRIGEQNSNEIYLKNNADVWNDFDDSNCLDNICFLLGHLHNLEFFGM